MPIVLFGVISISEIAAIVALVISTITTVILISNYIQTKKSVQIKLAWEIVDRIDVKYGKLKELFRIFTIERNKLASEYADVKHAMKDELTLIFSKSGDVFNSISSLLREIEYFGYFLSEDEIRDENILKFCIPRINETFNSLLLYLQTTESLKLRWEVSKDLDESIDSHSNQLLTQLKQAKNSIGDDLLDKYGPPFFKLPEEEAAKSSSPA